MMGPSLFLQVAATALVRLEGSTVKRIALKYSATGTESAPETIMINVSAFLNGKEKTAQSATMDTGSCDFLLHCAIQRDYLFYLSLSCPIDDWDQAINRSCCTQITLNPSPYPCDRSTCNNHGNCSYTDESSSESRSCSCDSRFTGPWFLFLPLSFSCALVLYSNAASGVSFVKFLPKPTIVTAYATVGSCPFFVALKLRKQTVKLHFVALQEICCGDLKNCTSCHGIFLCLAHQLILTRFAMM